MISSSTVYAALPVPEQLPHSSYTPTQLNHVSCNLNNSLASYDNNYVCHECIYVPNVGVTCLNPLSKFLNPPLERSIWCYFGETCGHHSRLEDMSRGGLPVSTANRLFIESNDIQFCTKVHCACQEQCHVCLGSHLTKPCLSCGDEKNLCYPC